MTSHRFSAIRRDLRNPIRRDTELSSAIYIDLESIAWRKPLAAILFLLPHLSPLFFFMSRARGYTEHRCTDSKRAKYIHRAYTRTHTRARDTEGYHRIPFILYGNRSVNRTVLVCVIDAIRCFVAIIRSSIP